MATHRCFVALDLPPEIRAAALEVQARLREQVPALRFTAPDNLHLTLKFLGELQEARCEDVAARLARIRCDGFGVRLGEAGCFVPRIVWVALRGADALQAQVDAALSEDFTSEHRFMGHITIARTHRIPPQVRHAVEALVVPALEIRVRSFSLQESHLSPAGPRYQTRAQYRLPGD